MGSQDEGACCHLADVRWTEEGLEKNGKLLFHFTGISTFSDNLNRISAYLFVALGVLQNIIFLLFQGFALIGDAYLRALDFLIVGEFSG